VASPRKRRAAFTLTEVLMAAGILGIGLTMVASIFPVAVDQSRRSRDQTMAALCARSVSAMLRANRTATVQWLNNLNTMSVYDVTTSFPEALRVYKPTTFLYTKDRSYTGVRVWDGGNYVARIWAARIIADGPYRITIVVARSSGRDPLLQAQSLWKVSTVRPMSGDYVIDLDTGLVGSTCPRGTGYLLDYVGYATTSPYTDKTGYYAAGKSAAGVATILPASAWLHVPNAVATYHMFLGN